MAEEALKSELVAKAQAKTEAYLPRIDKERASTLSATDLEGAVPYEKKYVGKVRDVYTTADSLILISTDRQSAFDRNLASIPFKGQVLNLTSQWWFDQTKDLVPNHILAVPHGNACIGKKCTVFSVEFVMRGYITGSTGTSLWTNYAKGVRQYCGHSLPEGLIKNQKLEHNLLTPTTKDDTHDELISAEEIVKTGRMSQEDWDLCSKYAQALFRHGQKVAESKGLILVDTKYEFGKDADGKIIIIDEVHTPDSSRYWVKETYDARLAQGLEPENIDKEFLRLWFKERCDPYNDATLPEAPPELVNELSRRYIMLYELITGLDFQFPEEGSSTNDSLREQLAAYYKK